MMLLTRWHVLHQYTICQRKSILFRCYLKFVEDKDELVSIRASITMAECPTYYEAKNEAHILRFTMGNLSREILT